MHGLHTVERDKSERIQQFLDLIRSIFIMPAFPITICRPNFSFVQLKPGRRLLFEMYGKLNVFYFAGMDWMLRACNIKLQIILIEHQVEPLYAANPPTYHNNSLYNKDTQCFQSTGKIGASDNNGEMFRFRPPKLILFVKPLCHFRVDRVEGLQYQINPYSLTKMNVKLQS